MKRLSSGWARMSRGERKALWRVWEAVWRVWEGCLEGVGSLSGGYGKAVWRGSGGYLEGVRRLS